MISHLKFALMKHCNNVIKVERKAYTQNNKTVFIYISYWIPYSNKMHLLIKNVLHYLCEQWD